MLMKKFQEDLNKWGAILCSWVGGFNIQNMPIRPKLIYTYTLNTISTRIPGDFMEMRFLQHMLKGKGTGIAKTILKKQ